MDSASSPEITKNNEMVELVVLGNHARDDLAQRAKPIFQLFNATRKTARSMQWTRVVSAAALGSVLSVGARGGRAAVRAVAHRPVLAIVLAGVAFSVGIYLNRRRKQLYDQSPRFDPEFPR